MNRRGFLGSLVGGIAAAAAVRTFPFRVFSFPAEIVIPKEEIFYGKGFATYLRAGMNMYDKHPLVQCRITGITVPTDDEVELYA